jgi:hypothetical protein
MHLGGSKLLTNPGRLMILLMLLKLVLLMQLTVELAVIKLREFGEHPFGTIPSQAYSGMSLKV